MNLKYIAYLILLFFTFVSCFSQTSGATELFFDGRGNLVSNSTITEKDDKIAGSNKDDTLNGLGGNDLIYGLGGNDTLDGGADADRVYGGADDDWIEGTLDGAVDVYDGGDGYDTVRYIGAKKALNFSFDATGGVATGEEIGTDTLIEIESVITGHGDDTVTVAPDAPSITLIYIAGKDVYKLPSASEVAVAFSPDLTPALVTVDNLVVDNAGRVTELTLNINGQGTLTLLGDDLAQKTFSFSDGTKKIITTAGIEPLGE